MADFKTPSFLENQGVDEIHDRMMSNLPDDMDVSEGSHPWNLTMPHAYEKSYMAEYIMTEAIKLIFPMFAEDYAEIMEYHADTRNMKRKEAQYATGELTITGVEGTEIPAGSAFSTVSVNGQPSIDFHTTQYAVIGEEGTVTVPIQALLQGLTGNVPANTILLNSSEIDNITSVTNVKETNGGLEEESIEDLQARIMEFDATQDVSYGGNLADYKRWALSVNGTGSAVVVAPLDDTGVITIILTDSKGRPASTELCTAVYNHIMSPENPEDRLAPVNDQISVVPPSTLTLVVTATVEITAGNSIEQAKSLFIEAMQEYIIKAAEEGEIKYSKVGSVLSRVAIINDYKDLKINNGTANIALEASKVPYIDTASVTFTQGTV